MIQANVAYTREDLAELGIGPVLLKQARAAGVKPRLVGQCHWYLGSELIKWISDMSPAKPRPVDLSPNRNILNGSQKRTNSKAKESQEPKEPLDLRLVSRG